MPSRRCAHHMTSDRSSLLCEGCNQRHTTSSVCEESKLQQSPYQSCKYPRDRLYHHFAASCVYSLNKRLSFHVLAIVLGVSLRTETMRACVVAFAVALTLTLTQLPMSHGNLFDGLISAHRFMLCRRSAMVYERYSAELRMRRVVYEECHNRYQLQWPL